MKEYAVPFSYEMYGRIEVIAENEQEAIKKAEEELDRMSTDEMHMYTNYLDDSLEIDTEGQILGNPVKKAVNIVWDYDEGDEGSFTELPGEAYIPNYVPDDLIRGYLCDKYGWQVHSYEVEKAA